MRYRIGLLADIHANVWALEAVLADLRKQGVDVLWNLGDILHGALKPRATYDLLRSTDIALTIRGNQDRELYEPNADPRVEWMIRDLGADAI
jgi:predicted phosphodiesterase